MLAAYIRYDYAIDRILSWINEIYPLNKYAITPEWIESSLANPNFLPNIPGNLRKKLINEYWTGKANARSNRVCNFTCILKPENFIAYIQSISTDIEPYFKVHIESTQPLETFIPKGMNIAKVVLGFWNYLSSSTQFVTIFIEPNLDIPFSLLDYQHDFITYNGREYSILPSFKQVINLDDIVQKSQFTKSIQSMQFLQTFYKNDTEISSARMDYAKRVRASASTGASAGAAASSYVEVSEDNSEQTEQIENSLTLLEIINNIRNGVCVIMPYTELAYPDTLVNIKEKIKKLNNLGLGIDSTVTLDRIITPQTKLDYYMYIQTPCQSKCKCKCKLDCNGHCNSDTSNTGNTGNTGKAGSTSCTRCNVVIESGELVCSTKCCQRPMHASCMLDLYLNEDSPHTTFKCDKCNLIRLDKHGRNTEILMGVCGLLL
jgi:hypothetical protein